MSRFIGGRTTICIVVIENDINQISARIATVAGTYEEYDLQSTADWGSKLSFQEAAGFFPVLFQPEYYTRYKPD